MENLKKAPRPRNAEKTRASILAAAQVAFSETGYAQTGIRDIAALAGVSSTLLLRYFGSKAGLFEAALIAATRSDDLFKSGRNGFGERLAGLFVDDSFEIRPPAMIALSTNDAEARDITTRVTRQHVLKPLARWLGPPDASVRALEIFMLATMFVLYTRQLPLAPPGRTSGRKLSAWFAESVQAIVDGR